MSKESIYTEVTMLMESLFDIAPDSILPESKLYEELGLDSIDAVDMVVHLQKKIGKKIKPEVFKEVRTVQDVVDVVATLVEETA